MSSAKPDLYKKVVVTVEGEDNVAAALEVGLLSRDFAAAVVRAPSAEVTLKKNKLQLSIARDELSSLVADEAENSLLAEAFHKADERLRRYDESRVGLGKRFWDHLVNRDRIKADQPLAKVSEPLPSLSGSTLTIYRYGA